MPVGTKMRCVKYLFSRPSFFGGLHDLTDPGLVGLWDWLPQPQSFEQRAAPVRALGQTPAPLQFRPMYHIGCHGLSCNSRADRTQAGPSSSSKAAMELTGAHGLFHAPGNSRGCRCVSLAHDPVCEAGSQQQKFSQNPTPLGADNLLLAWKRLA